MIVACKTHLRRAGYGLFLGMLYYVIVWRDLFQPDNRISLVMDRTRLIIVKPGSKTFL